MLCFSFKELLSYIWKYSSVLDCYTKERASANFDDINKPPKRHLKAQEESQFFNSIAIINSVSKTSHHGIILHFLLKRNFKSVI